MKLVKYSSQLMPTQLLATVQFMHLQQIMQVVVVSSLCVIGLFMIHEVLQRFGVQGFTLPCAYQRLL